MNKIYRINSDEKQNKCNILWNLVSYYIKDKL